MRTLLIAIAALTLLACESRAQTQASTATVKAEDLLLPPSAPAHEKRQLTTATELARDLADVVSYLEAGQAYFRAYQKGTHNKTENAEFLQFVQAYEGERETAKKEMELLRRWVQERSALDTPPVP